MGMTADHDFPDRDVEHNYGALLKGTSKDSRFYRMYPHSSVAHLVKGQRKGLSDNLRMYRVLGAPIGADVNTLVKIFNPSKPTLKKLGSIHKDLSHDKCLKRSFHYALEIASGLCLNPSSNASTNPGWEQALKHYYS